MKLSELPIDWEAARKNRKMRQEMLQEPPQYVGNLKGKFSCSLNDLPDSSQEYYHGQGVVSMKHEHEYSDVELFIQGDGRVTDRHGLPPFLTNGIAYHYRIMVSGDATESQQRAWQKVLGFLLKG